MTAECEHKHLRTHNGRGVAVLTLCEDCRMPATDIIAALRAERDAYKRAKAENDERFMLDAAEQRARAERAERALQEILVNIALLRGQAPKKVREHWFFDWADKRIREALGGQPSDGTLVTPEWPQFRKWTEEEGGGPGVFSRMGLAEDLQRWLNAPWEGKE